MKTLRMETLRNPAFVTHPFLVSFMNRRRRRRALNLESFFDFRLYEAPGKLDRLE